MKGLAAIICIAGLALALLGVWLEIALLALSGLILAGIGFAVLQAICNAARGKSAMNRLGRDLERLRQDEAKRRGNGDD